MKTRWLSALLVLGLLLFTPIPSIAGERHHGHHHFHGRGARFFIGVGPVWPAPWWYSPPPPVIVQAPPAVVVQQVPVHVPPPPTPPQYWYICQSFNAYYPRTPTCPEP